MAARFPFSKGSATFNNKVDMEALTFGPDMGATYLYIGDEYNVMYQMNIADGTLARQWDLKTDLGISTSVDKGIESIAYNVDDGLFYVGIQEEGKVYAFTVDPACTQGSDCVATKKSDFSVAKSPSGLFYYPLQKSLYVSKER